MVTKTKQQSFLPHLSLLVVLSTGCGDGRIKTYPVSGKVLVNGKPHEGVAVILHPQAEGEKIQKKRPYGKTNKQGEFELTTYQRHDGAPEGEYKVTAVWVGPVGPPPRGSRRPAIGDRLRGRYAKVGQSELSVTIDRGKNQLPALELQTPAPRRSR